MHNNIDYILVGNYRREITLIPQTILMFSDAKMNYKLHNLLNNEKMKSWRKEIKMYFEQRKG